MSFIKAAVIGHPVSHSKSPLIHNYWIDKYDLNGSYEAIDIAPADLEAGIRRLIDRGYTGFNITVPHKEAIMGLCDEIEVMDDIIGAVNTLCIEGGKIKGFNTDTEGFHNNILENAPFFDFEKGPAVVLGAGGAARAVLAVLMADTPEIFLLNRTKERAEKLAHEAKQGPYDGQIHVVDWEDRANILSVANFLVNTTTLGMNGQPPLEIDLKNLPHHALVNDIVYAPLMTQLLQDAEARGNRIVTGIGMLLHQAAPAFRAWFGVMPEVTDELQELVLK